MASSRQSFLLAHPNAINLVSGCSSFYLVPSSVFIIWYMVSILFSRVRGLIWCVTAGHSWSEMAAGMSVFCNWNLR